MRLSGGKWDETRVRDSSGRHLARHPSEGAGANSTSATLSNHPTLAARVHPSAARGTPMILVSFCRK
jgi:hypothetical protein